MTTSYYFSVYENVLALSGDDHVVLWLKDKAKENHSNPCPYCRRMKLYGYVMGAIKKGLPPEGFELVLGEK